VIEISCGKGSSEHLSVSLAMTPVVSREQSRPPYPLLHTQAALQVASDTVHSRRVWPEGSKYLHEPCWEHTVPRGRNVGKRWV
jgi:hypothetical protein